MTYEFAKDYFFSLFCCGGIGQLEGEQLNSLIHALEEWERHLAQLDSKSLRCVDVKLIP